MLNYLCVSVTFLDPLPAFHGRGDAGEPEWPPSPLRVFQALVAAAASRWRATQFQEYAQPALEWLQRQVASIIVAPSHHVGVPVRIAVPNNDLDVVATAWTKGQEPKKQPNELKTMKTVRPTRLLVNKDDPATVHYLLPLADGSCPHLDVLTAAARSMTHLGWGIDMVAANAAVMSEADADQLPGERWRPVQDSSATGYRVPVPGTLDALVQKHQAFLNRIERDAKGNESFKPVPPLSAFRVVSYRRSTDPPARPFSAFAFYRPDADKRRFFPATLAIAVAGMVRCLTGKMARQTGHCEAGVNLEQWVNEYVMGHEETDGLRPRFSYLPLPTIRPPNVLGGINRVLIVEPPGGAGSHAAWAAQILRGQILVSEAQREEAILMRASDDWVLQQYVGKSATWATVTPVVLPGSDEGRYAKAEKLFRKALRHSGYGPELLDDFEFRKVSFWPGGDLSLRYQRPNYLQENHWSVYHMRLRWKHALKGPLAMGAGRHCGLGIFAATSE